MIVCHCNCISHTEIESSANALTGGDLNAVVTPVAVYKHLGRRPRCGGCLQLAANIIYTRGCPDQSNAGECPLTNGLAIAVDPAE